LEVDAPEHEILKMAVKAEDVFKSIPVSAKKEE
jgi:hypothetical protein